MGALDYLSRKQIHRWGPDFVRHMLLRRRESARARGTRHLLFSFSDHWEPLFAGVPDEQGDARVRAWAEGYPKLA